MKGICLAILISAVYLGTLGCADRNPTLIYDTRRTATGDELQIVSLGVKPARPVAFENWRAAMEIKNVSRNPVAEIRYVILANQDEIGRGRIPLLRPNESIQVISELSRNRPGTYRVTGKILSPAGQEASTNTVRMMTIVVAQ